MTSKSTTQRVVEAVAVVAVIGFGIVITLSLWTRTPPEAKPEGSTPLTPVPGTPQVMADPTPKRERVDSVAKLPASYPRIDELALAPPQSDPAAAVLGADLPAVAAAAHSGAKVQHLNAWALGQVLVDPRGETAIVEEQTPAGTRRLAVWNLSTGKLLRFLSMALGQGTRPFQGKENDNFGSPVDAQGNFSEFVFSPGGKRFATKTSEANEGLQVWVWDVDTGKLLSQYRETESSYEDLLFPHEDYLVIAVSLPGEESALARIHAATGEAELLVGLGMGGHLLHNANATVNGNLAFVGNQALHVFEVASREHWQIPVSSSANHFLKVCFASADGKRLTGVTQEYRVQHWNVDSGQFVRSKQLSPSPQQGHGMLAAPQADLVAVKVGSRQAYFYDIETSKLISIVQMPFQRGDFVAISSDARRLVFKTDQSSLLVVNWPGKLPAGTINLIDVLPKGKLAATR